MPRKQESRDVLSKRRRKLSTGGGGHHDDDSSVDEYGNIRGLIDYSSESSLSSDETSESQIQSVASPIARRTRSKTTHPSRKPKIGALMKQMRLRKLSKKMQDSSDSEDDIVIPQRRRLKKVSDKEKEKASKIKEESEEETMEDEEEDEEDYEEDTDDEEEDEAEQDEEDEEEDDEEMSGPPGISINFGTFGSSKPTGPKRHNLKKETEDVRKFVKLVSQPTDENSIDTQIDQYKALPDEHKRKLLDALEKSRQNPSVANPTQSLMFKLLTMNLPTDLQSVVLAKFQSLQNADSGSSEYYKLRSWLEKLTSLPLGIYKEMPVKLEDGSGKCNEFMARARRCLDEAIFGQDEAKLQVLQFIGAKIANPNSRGLSLMLAGPPGIGKTSLIKNGIAKALDWPFQFISLGGDSDATTYTGHQLVYEGSHCGKIANSLIAAKSMSLVLMFDEVDKISTTPKGEEVQNMLIHLTDPVQNGEFEDKYLAGVPLDLSRVLFAFSANDLGKLDRVLLDRFVVIKLAGYEPKEKITIAANYLFPQALKELGLDERVAVSKDVIQHIVEDYAKDEAGVRELKRCIEQIVQKLNMLRLFNTSDLPFHIKDFSLPFVLKKEHVDIFLKKKNDDKDVSFLKMYL